jgi:hypothetical protein
VAGCSVGAPPGFSSGDHWTFPLVGPLEDGLLLTPASVHGHGPYLFAIDPDANVSAIDKQVVEEAGLRTGQGPHRIDETDTGQIRIYAELLDLKVASLAIDRRDVMVFPVGHYDTEDRHVNGILGRDVLADSLVFGFDRDQGIATLSTIKAFTPPAEATRIKYQSVSSRSSAFTSNVEPISAAGQSGAPLPDVAPVPRRLATVQIGDARFAMHLDLGAAASQLPEASWPKARLIPTEVKLRLVDEAATVRQVSTGGIATDVTLGTTKTFRVTFVPFIEKRFATEGVDGALGLNFFRPYAVYASWDSATYYLKSRGDAAATTVARLGRWGADLPSCPHPGCVSAELVAADGGLAVHVTRDPQAGSRGLEVFFGVAPAAGKSAAPLVVELPSSADQLTAPVPAEYAGATLTVLDASPFPRSCPGDGGCVVQLGGSAPDAAPELAPGARPAPAVTTRPLDKLHRLTGDQAIPPSDEVRTAAAGKPLGVAIVKVCLTAEGKIESTKLVKSSGVLVYDAQLQSTIQATWTFEPDAIDGKPAPVCTQVTFLAH